MSLFLQIQKVLGTDTRSIFAEVPLTSYTPIDLSTNNQEIEDLELSDPQVCQAYVNTVLETAGALAAYGGYLEERNLYLGNPNFENEEQSVRNIHLGMDFWAPAGTEVLAPVAGRVHSFKNNEAPGDYGPTIILSHEILGLEFHSLYGHLSPASLDGLYEGKPIHEGSILGSLGSPEVNVNYAPHLHFQIIFNIGEYVGDYPGVCSSKELEWYKANCPDPNILLNYP